MDKKELRKIFRKKRNQISGKSEKDFKIAERVLSLEEVKNSRNILIYVSYGSETDTYSIIKRLLEEEKKVAVPRCLENGIMEFIYIKSLDELSAGAFGIPEPSGNIRAVINKNTVCIVPALSFSPDGTRLGYGGGYYDRFLESENIYTVGICYDEMLSESLPSEKHDVKIKKVITEERTVQCSAER
ncbi:MAG: 5-formyltetrahydrofolate cyclo-ligase [Ruminococcus sp.]|nr:5-formyltetrahydrofolate cyclo-ligase [Oscillospiraceae bacterium]MDY4414700.1 5-formyltetrahydrofolate cyclo-ligase [Ruminococcus sp.]